MTDDAKALATDSLQEADDCHDEDPLRGAMLLRRIDPAVLDASQRPLYAYLLNHVLGEKLGQYLEAWQGQQAVLAAAGSQPPLPLLRHAAAAARLAGDASGEDRLTARLASAAGVGPAQASELVDLAATSFRMPALANDAAGEAAMAALARLRGVAWQKASGLDAAAAALTSNIATDLAERPVAQLRSTPLRLAMAEAATLAQTFWHRAGQWVQHERAHYLRSVVANALGDANEAELQARAGLVLLENFDHEQQERVDQAFLRSELAHALARQGRSVDAQVERAQADALVEALDDPSISAWYGRRVARQAALDAVM